MLGDPEEKGDLGRVKGCGLPFSEGGQVFLCIVSWRCYWVLLLLFRGSYVIWGDPM